MSSSPTSSQQKKSKTYNIPARAVGEPSLTAIKTSADDTTDSEEEERREALRPLGIAPLRPRKGNDSQALPAALHEPTFKQANGSEGREFELDEMASFVRGDDHRSYPSRQRRIEEKACKEQLESLGYESIERADVHVSGAIVSSQGGKIRSKNILQTGWNYLCGKR